MIRSLALFVVFFVGSLSASAEAPKYNRLSAVPFTDVKVSDSFWTPRIEANRTASLPQNLQICRETGRIDNFAKAAGLMEGKYDGYFFNDSDVYKLLEGIANSLAVSPDPKLEKQADEIIELISAAQRPDGYLNTYYTLTAPDRRWTNIRIKHELYCAGHLIEAAVAYHQATGKRKLLDVAEKFVDHIDSVFGPDRLREPPGHEEIELALVKLHRLTGKEKYLKLAEFFTDMRGDPTRPQRWGTEYQDHAPFRSQDEIYGHAVRAMYLCAGAADVAAHTGDRSLIEALDRLWKNMTGRKMYVTGGIGSRPSREEFGFDFELPNEKAYCETCAAIGVAFWAHRMNLLLADSQYADVMERAMYNNVLSGVGLDGKTYFYVNPIVSDGSKHRKAYHKCSCCPINLVRFLPTLPGYIYATGDSGGSHQLYVNLFASGEGDAEIGGNRVRIKQETKYPWDGKVRLTLEPNKAETFALCLRVPGWCRGATVSVNGRPVEPLTIEKGYARLDRRWQRGDVVELNLPMSVERIGANPRLKDVHGRVAVRRGPIVYCFEAVDNGGSVKDLTLPADPKFAAEHRGGLLGGVTVITGMDKDGRPITAVPYNVWDNRAPGEMAVWVRQQGMPSDPLPDDASWNGMLYRPIAAGELGVESP